MPTTFANSIDSNPIYAARAENDKDGNRIDTTYAKLADIPSGTQLVPAATSADADKVLTVNAQGVPGWAAGGGGSTYTAGDGIDITNNEISAKIGTGLEFGTFLNPVTTTAHANGSLNGVTVMAAPMEPSVANAIETTGITYTVQNLLDNNNVSQAWTYSDVSGLKIYPAICALAYDGDRNPYADTTSILVLSTTGMDVSNTSGSIPAGTQFVYNLNDINTTLSTIQWETIAADPNYTLCVVWPVSGGLSSLVANGDFTKYRLYDSGTITAMEEVTGAILVSNPLPASTSSDANKVLKVNASGEPEWATGGGGGSTQADWTEADSSDPSYIQNKPTPKTLTAGANISISEGVGTLTISAAPGLPASTSADEGKCLVVDSNGDPEWGTGGKTYTGTDGVVVDNVNDTVGLEAPVDIVAGPGIAIDNPDGNTLRVSADENYEVVLFDGDISTSGGNGALSEAPANFKLLRIEWYGENTTEYGLKTSTFANDGRNFAGLAVGGLAQVYSNFAMGFHFGYLTLTDTTVTLVRQARTNFTTGTIGAYSNENGMFHLVRVVGIHRIAND